MRNKTLTYLLFAALLILLVCFIVFFVITTYTNSSRAISADSREGGIGNYAPSYSSGVLVSIDETNYLVYVDIAMND